MPNDYDLMIEDDPSEADVAFVEERIAEFNITTTGYDDYQPLAVFSRNETGAIIAGLTGFTWGGTLRIGYLWVDASLRGQGYGARLMRAAEDAARARGCRQATVDSHSFQAPDFYVKQGYSQCGVVDDSPTGYQDIVLQKHLT